ncbi:MAG TPA: guanylate kinase [Deltaproteobacteria bacterium]|nr:guanylate kinase [Deltaproteobacteria bacterium]
MKKRGIPFIVSAPSGTGKTTLCRMAVERFGDLRESISYTTRPPREGEVDGIDYRFVDAAVFDEMVRTDRFVEYAEVHGNRYGTSARDLAALLDSGEDVILDIDVQGAEKVRRSVEGGVYIFILPPSLETCEARLRARGKDSDETIRRRLLQARHEIGCAALYDYIIINDRLEEAFTKLSSIIVAERSRASRMADRVRALFGEGDPPGPEAAVATVPSRGLQGGEPGDNDKGGSTSSWRE